MTTTGLAALQQASATSAAQLRTFGTAPPAGTTGVATTLSNGAIAQPTPTAAPAPSTMGAPAATSPTTGVPVPAAPPTAAQQQQLAAQQAAAARAAAPPPGRYPKLHLSRDASTVETLTAMSGAMHGQPHNATAVAKIYEVQQQLLEGYKSMINVWRG